MGGKEGAKEGVGFFFIFNRKPKRKWKKYVVHFVKNLSRILSFFFHSSIKTEEVLFFYIYIYTYIFIYIYICINIKN